MKIHEYQAKDLLAAAGANAPRPIVVSNADDAARAFDQLAAGGGVVVKGQVHAGGRGQGQLVGLADQLGGGRGSSSATPTSSAGSSSSPRGRRRGRSPRRCSRTRSRPSRPAPTGRR